MYDIIVIGAGSGGLNIAGFMNKAGFSVLLIDKSDEEIGGDCLNFGCVPSKALIHIARAVHAAKTAETVGLKTSGTIDLKKVMAYVKTKQEIIRKHENARYFRELGMGVVLGLAKFTSRNSVEVAGKTYRGKKIVIATGSAPRVLDVPGIEKVNYLTNENIFSLKVLPEKLLVIGGGPIGIELGQAFQMLGSKVTVVQNSETFLPKEEPKIAQVLLTGLEKQGMKFHFECRPTEFTKKNEVRLRTKDKSEVTLQFDEVLISIGRVLDFSGLNLDAAGISTDNGKLVLDDYLRTTNKNVYVVGDAAGSFQFTHAAELHAGIVISNFFSPFKKKVKYDNLSWVTYTTPEIATFGLSKKALDERGIKYETLNTEFTEDDRAIVDSYDGKLMLHIAGSRILGGSMVSAGAGELFQELVLANSSKIDIKQIFNKTYPYPTATRINKRIISGLFRRKLNRRTKKILRWLY